MHKIDREHLKLHRNIYREIREKIDFDTSNFTMKVGAKLALFILLIVGTYSLMISTSSPLLLISSYIIYGFLMVLVAFNFSHDFSHDNVFSNKTWNEIGYLISFVLVGAHSEGWKERHINAHHIAPNVEDYDPDLNITEIIRVLPSSKHRWYHKYQHIYAPFAYTTYSFFWVFIKDFIILYSESKKSLMYHVSFYLQKLAYICILVIIPIIFSDLSFYWILASFIIMHLTQSLFLLLTFFMTHHVTSTSYPNTDDQGQIDTSWVMNQIKSSNDMNPFCKITNFILGGFNNHIAHHLFPNIHHVYYPKVSKIIYRHLRNYGIEPNHTTYWGGVKSHMGLLKKMGLQPNPKSM